VTQMNRHGRRCLDVATMPHGLVLGTWPGVDVPDSITWSARVSRDGGTEHATATFPGAAGYGNCDA
jgi:hypothetical protein